MDSTLADNLNKRSLPNEDSVPFNNDIPDTNGSSSSVSSTALNRLETPSKKPKLETDSSISEKTGAATLHDDKEILIPMTPKHSIRIAKNIKTNKYIYPKISRDETTNARMYLKYYGLKIFLDTYLPKELNSLYIHYLIRLLGYDVKDRELLSLIEEHTGPNSHEDEISLSYESIEDPLDKKNVVRLIKDLQKAINKVLSTRLRLSKFFTINSFIERLKNAKNILVLTGAGVSTSLGIPDFRSSEGFYSKIKHLGLDDPQDVFNLDIFMQDPSVFYNIAHMILPPDNIYSPLHSFIKMLQDKGKLLRNYTQNIDNLESNAGIEADNLVQCHGSFATASCVTCHWRLPGSNIFDNIRKMELPLCPYCYQKRREYFPTISSSNQSYDNSSYNSSTALKSYGVLKPDITFFGQALPSKFHRTIREDIKKCDLLICIGTSLKVAPVSEIVNMIPAHVPQVLINRDPVKHAEFDLNLLGYCDDVATMVAQKCEWDIPHKRWNDLKHMDVTCNEIEKGTYQVALTENL